jgi:hypothetical protein
MTSSLLNAPLTDLGVPLPVRSLVGGGTTPEGLATAMADRLPPGGMAAPRMRGRHRLAGATWRLLDSRVLAAALDILDADVATPLVTWLSRYERVAKAAATTLTDAQKPEITEVLLPPRPFTHSTGLTVDVLVEERPAASVHFRLDVSAALAETSVVVRRGRIHEVACDVLTVTAGLFLAEWPTALWKPAPVKVPRAHLRLDPPVAVPLIPVPRKDASAPA